MSNPTYTIEKDCGSHVWVRQTFDLNAPNCPGVLLIDGRKPEPLPTRKEPARFLLLMRLQAIELGLLA